MGLSEFVKKERLNRGLTQDELARKVKISRISIIKIESGNRVGSLIVKKLSKFFKKPIIELIKMMEEDLNNENNKQS